MIVKGPKKKRTISRYLGLNIIMLIIFFVIISKLIYIQVYKNEEYKEKADISSTRFISEKAPRGKIYDSEGNILATNIQTYALTYTNAEESEKYFYRTMDSVFKILSDNGEKFQDDLLLKIDSNSKFYYEFKSSDAEVRKSVELRFKRDRGLNENIEKRLYGNKKEDFTDEEVAKVDEELLKISSQDVFYELVKIYNMYELINSEPTKEEQKAFDDMSGKEMTELLLQKYSIYDIRNYMVIKDAIKMQSFKGYRAVNISSNIKKDTAFIIYQKLNDLPGIDVTLEPIRYYPYNNLASAAIGYVSSIDSSNKKNYELRGYDVSSDLIGVSGIESAFENELKGDKGGTTVKVNSKGRVTEELFKLESYPGNDIHLTIDKRVQYAAQEAMKDTLERIRQEGQIGATRGAAVAIEANTGRIIAMVSYPDYNPNLFSVPGSLTPEETQKYFSPDLDSFGKEYIAKTNAAGGLNGVFPLNEETGLREDKYDIYPRSFFNYATQGLIPPGSVFKPLTSIIGLQEGVITPNEIIVDRGEFKEHPDVLGEGFAPQCMIYTTSRSTHGATDLRKALQVSCNYYYYEVGYRLYMKNGANIGALDSIAKYAWKFGLGVDPESKQNASTGLEVNENFGQTYNFESWKNRFIPSVMFQLVDYLKTGNYNGCVYFVPLDIEKSESDSEELMDAKKALKDKITTALGKVGTKEQRRDTDNFAKELEPDIKNIMKVSDKYKEEVKAYEVKNGKKVNLDDEVESVAEAIARFTIDDKTTEIISAAQIVYDSIGQSMNAFTPVQIANYMATLVNGGTRYKVHMVDKITSPTGEVMQEFKPEVLDTINISPDNVQAIKEGMYGVNTDPANGVAYQCFGNFPFKVGGKTGTADFSTEGTEVGQYGFLGRQPYGNYLSFAPLENPKLVVFTTVYDGKKGSSAATIARAIYESYFKDELLKMDPNYAAKSASFKKYVVDCPLKDNKPKDDVDKTKDKAQ